MKERERPIIQDKPIKDKQELDNVRLTVYPLLCRTTLLCPL